MNFFSQRQKQKGLSLITTLMMLVIISALAVTAAKMALFDQQSSRNQREYDIAFQAAEAALRDAENDITMVRNGVVPNPIAFSIGCTPASDTCQGVSFTINGTVYKGCTGLCTPDPSSTTPIWKSIDFNADASSSSPKTVAYGQFTGATYPTATLLSPKGGITVQLPRYIIETVQITGPNESACTGVAGCGTSSINFRLTAVGFGSTTDTQVVLQSIIKFK